ncbi:MAG: hypothetical protein ACLUEQ_05600 [Cloacibacillus evryensis]
MGEAGGERTTRGPAAREQAVFLQRLTISCEVFRLDADQQPSAADVADEGNGPP